MRARRWQCSVSAFSAFCRASAMVRPLELQSGRSGNETRKPASGCLRMKAMNGRMVPPCDDDQRANHLVTSESRVFVIVNAEASRARYPIPARRKNQKKERSSARRDDALDRDV